MRLPAALLLFPVLGCVLGCAVVPPPSGGPRLLMTFDSAEPEAAINFPSLSYEALMRFDLPEESHDFSRLWIHVGSPGSIRWAIYESNALEGPGAVLHEGVREITTKETAVNRHGPWLVEDVSRLGARKGTIWVGVKKLGGEPTVSATRKDSGTYFVRDENPNTKIDLLPVRRTPLIRLELVPRR